MVWKRNKGKNEGYWKKKDFRDKITIFERKFER